MLTLYNEAQLTAEMESSLCRRDVLDNAQLLQSVSAILEQIERDGIEAVIQLTRKFDQAEISELKVERQQFEQAEKKLPAELKRAFQKAASNISEFHQLQREEYGDKEKIIAGTRVGYRHLPVESAGIYVPGGRASYPSSLLMGLIPAQVAGVPRSVVITPPLKDGSVDPVVLYCAHLVGCQEVIPAGGVQGIAAAALGLTGAAVEVIAGPGNRYVTAAKLLLSARGIVRIDCPAGPSEIMVIADETANPQFVAADMLSQAEHGEDSVAVLLTNSRELAQAAAAEIERGIAERPERQDMKRASIEKHSFGIIYSNFDAAFDFANRFAPEHLEICTNDPKADLQKIKNAGSIFLGHNAPVALGDYYSGTNHILPTGGAARSFSGLGVDFFLKRITYQHPTVESLREALEPVVLMSRCEGFEHEHGNSIKMRFQKGGDFRRQETGGGQLSCWPMGRKQINAQIYP